MSQPAPLLFVDASLYVFRAWHSMPDDFTDAEGWPANAVHGFARFVLELIERERPTHLVVAFDESLTSSFRNALFPAYKANREPAPEALQRQFRHCMAFCRALGLPTLVDSSYEADDLIGSAMRRLRQPGRGCVVVSADKDLSQLLQPGDVQWDYARGQRWGHAEVVARYGVHAHQIPCFLGLAGDAVDNIPGIPGIGAKTAIALLAHFNSLDELLERQAEVGFLRLRGAAAHARRLAEHGPLALLSRQLATIACDAPLPDGLGDGRRTAADTQALDDLMETLRMGPMTRRRVAALPHPTQN